MNRFSIARLKYELSDLAYKLAEKMVTFSHYPIIEIDEESLSEEEKQIFRMLIEKMEWDLYANKKNNI